MEPVHAVVLAAGKGKRMHSDLPKVLHLLCGQPLILYVLDALHHAGIPSSIVVVGQGDDRVREVVGPQARYVEQPEPRGTGHAVMTALPLLPQDGNPVLVLYGDTPLLTAETIHALLALHRPSGSAATLLSAQVPDPAGYGRVIRDHDGRVRKIVEEVDCSAEERQVSEINAGTYVFRHEALREALRALAPDNAQGEYYITDTIGWLLARGHQVSALVARGEDTVGVNSRQELAAAEALMRRRLLDRLMEGGVTIIDPATTYVHAGVQVGAGTVTCNYDGKRKHNTIIDDEAFIGSDTMLIAPIRIGKGAMTGAGSVVNKDVPPGGVAVGVPARVIRYVPSER